MQALHWPCRQSHCSNINCKGTKLFWNNFLFRPCTMRPCTIAHAKLSYPWQYSLAFNFSFGVDPCSEGFALWSLSSPIIWSHATVSSDVILIVIQQGFVCKKCTDNYIKWYMHENTFTNEENRWNPGCFWEQCTIMPMINDGLVLIQRPHFDLV